MTRPQSNVLVIGAGVSGLTTAVTLAEAGWPVRVWTRDDSSQTTSYAAGAIWCQYLAAHRQAEHWAQKTLTVLSGLVDVDGSGVRMVNGIEASRVGDRPPSWTRRLDHFRMVGTDELPAGFASGWSYDVPLVEMPRYLGYLRSRLSAAGGVLDTVTVDSLKDLDVPESVVVNCTGLGARQLVADNELVQVRGEVIVVDNPGVDRFFTEYSDDAVDLTYILPHGDHVVLGGSAHRGRSDLTPDPQVHAAILRRCGEVEPALLGAQVRERRVGLRPSRPQIRIEHEWNGRRHVVHNYGHGGSGITLSWGCAGAVRSMVEGL